ncbi:MAG: hypothetical protein ACERKV_04600 [Clostridiaceae bacterium]
MDKFIPILEIFLAAIAIILFYNVLKKYVLYKIKISKWVVLFLAILSYFIPIILEAYGVKLMDSLWQYVFAGIFAMFLFWFFDLLGWMKPRARKNTKDEIVIKAKAKPNRAKHK